MRDFVRLQTLQLSHNLKLIASQCHILSLQIRSTTVAHGDLIASKPLLPHSTSPASIIMQKLC